MGSPRGGRTSAVATPKGHVQDIRISDIHILNPRSRSKRVHTELVENIRLSGLKRPITVSRTQSTSGHAYQLVCGQGRIEALALPGKTTVPAVVIDATEEDCLAMSLVENVASRSHLLNGAYVTLHGMPPFAAFSSSIVLQLEAGEVPHLTRYFSNDGLRHLYHPGALVMSRQRGKPIIIDLSWSGVLRYADGTTSPFPPPKPSN